MPRTCFVIMPFSSTASCTSEEWTHIFENVFKPAIESSGLDYECRRSKATRGNVIAAIIRDLNDSYVVIADLTDRNANVFYELGVRHSLKNRTIIIAQKREDIPSDLQGYASHVYSWKTQKDKDELAQRLRELLEEIDTNPERSDSPVNDFLLRDRNARNQPLPVYEEQLHAEQAVRGFAEAVEKPQGISLNSAAREFNVPQELFWRWVKGRGIIPILSEGKGSGSPTLIDRGKAQEVAEAYHEAKQVVDTNFVQCDVAPIFNETNRRLVPMPYDANMQFSTFLDRFYTTALHSQVPLCSYGINWQIRAADSGQAFPHQYHNQRVAEPDPMRRARFRDTRTLHEIGIQPGMLLIADPISADFPNTRQPY